MPGVAAVQLSRRVLKEYLKLQKTSAHLFSINEFHEDDQTCEFLKSYSLIEAVSSGASATVFKALNLKDSSIVALKVVNLVCEKQKKAMLREIRVHKQLSHPNVVHLIDYSYSDNFVILVMEYVEKTLLVLLINNKYQLPEHQIAMMVKELLKALEYIHQSGFVHFDLKLDNILVTETGQIKVCDFGSSIEFGKSTALKPTLLYCPPEVVNPLSPVCPTDKTDVWSIGVVLFSLLGGHLPFENSKDIKLNRVTFLTDIWKHRSRDARNLLSKLITKNVKQRYTIQQALHHPWFKGSIKRNDTTPLCIQLYKDFKQLSIKHFPNSKVANLAFMYFEIALERWALLLGQPLKLQNENILITDKKTSICIKKIDWMKDSEAKHCKVCDSRFEWFNRRHHCRICGFVICNSCSKTRNSSNDRICDLCKK